MSAPPSRFSTIPLLFYRRKFSPLLCPSSMKFEWARGDVIKLIKELFVTSSLNLIILPLKVASGIFKLRAGSSSVLARFGDVLGIKMASCSCCCIIPSQLSDLFHTQAMKHLWAPYRQQGNVFLQVPKSGNTHHWSGQARHSPSRVKITVFSRGSKPYEEQDLIRRQHNFYC